MLGGFDQVPNSSAALCKSSLLLLIKKGLTKKQEPQHLGETMSTQRLTIAMKLLTLVRIVFTFSIDVFYLSFLHIYRINKKLFHARLPVSLGRFGCSSSESVSPSSPSPSSLSAGAARWQIPLWSMFGQAKISDWLQMWAYSSSFRKIILLFADLSLASTSASSKMPL